MNIAVIGGGISGITTAYLLSKSHQVTLFEKNAYVGGHTNTQIVTDDKGHAIPVDTGFIVCNPTNYPHFYRLLQEWQVGLQDSHMSFGFCCEKSGFTYVGPTIRDTIATWTNFFSPTFLKFLYERFRFNRRMLHDLNNQAIGDRTLGEYLRSIGVSTFFIENYLTPLLGSIWSAPDSSTENFPAETFARFFNNHGMLDFRKIPRWQTVVGGSHSYLNAFKQRFKGTIQLSSEVTQVARSHNGCELRFSSGETRTFDKVVLATHADQSLALLTDPSPAERQALSSWSYSHNETVLHTDASVMPSQREAWAAWNYYRRIEDSPAKAVQITYYMNVLQSLKTTTDYFVTLNRETEIDQSKVIYQINYTHPVYTADSIKAQAILKQLNGTANTFYCGAYLGYGFHEDGVNSALEVTKHFGIEL